jgi:hypothetical protein
LESSDPRDWVPSDEDGPLYRGTGRKSPSDVDDIFEGGIDHSGGDVDNPIDHVVKPHGETSRLISTSAEPSVASEFPEGADRRSIIEIDPDVIRESGDEVYDMSETLERLGGRNPYDSEGEQFILDRIPADAIISIDGRRNPNYRGRL